jgi:phage tail-like protein
MRGHTDGLVNPHPIVDLLPGLLQDDAFIQRFADGLDHVLAPVLLSLDNIDAYLDPGTAPPDFVEWIAEWVGIALDENWPLQQQRALVAQAVDLFHWRGTVRGLSAHVALYAGVEPEIFESGASAWSPAPNASLPGEASPNLVVRVRVADPAGLDAARLDQIVSASKPAHIPHSIEVLGAA